MTIDRSSILWAWRYTSIRRVRRKEARDQVSGCFVREPGPEGVRRMVESGSVEAIS